jgi:hypothetical protein|tara:strand:- start:2276 stop:2524 length:249 start_codon:yes stop_codon:yes gene_type:complete
MHHSKDMTRSPEMDAWLDHWSEQITDWETRNQKNFLGGVSRRGRFEKWLDRHNHKMELMRTLTSLMAAVFSALALGKLLEVF